MLFYLYNLSFQRRTRDKFDVVDYMESDEVLDLGMPTMESEKFLGMQKAQQFYLLE